MKQEPVDLETQIATLSLLDVQGIDWERVQRTAYLIHQHFRYDYPGPVRELQQRLLIVPPDVYGDQKCIMHRLDVSAHVAETTREVDDFGNAVLMLHIPLVERSIDFEAWIVVERSTDHGPHILPGEILIDSRYREPSALTQPNEELRRAAAMLLQSEQEIETNSPTHAMHAPWELKGRQEEQQPAALARRINDWVHNALSYEHGATGIHTTAAQALALGRGVCQDYAHLMLALCRICGQPARYVSGHLLGEGGTHAWVEVLVPAPGRPGQALALAFDPTHGCGINLHYITVAVGRDYYDVAPTSGTFQAPYPGQLTARKRVGPISLEYAGSN